MALAAAMLSGCGAHHPTPAVIAKPPVEVSAGVREALPDDYLRVSFMAKGVTVTSLGRPVAPGRPGALRAFTTATVLYEPPLTVADLPVYLGVVNEDNKVLVAMRCRPPQPEKVDAVLATWPNVFAAIQRDVPVDDAACNAEHSDQATEMACYAKKFNDPPSTAVPASLAKTFSYAGVLYGFKPDCKSDCKPNEEPKNTELAEWLQSNYGIFPAFAGTGYAVKDSREKEPMTAQQILAKSISSEYILKNVSLSEAGCRCISVEPYAGRSAAPLDPEFIEQAGGAGECKEVQKLTRITTNRRSEEVYQHRDRRVVMDPAVVIFGGAFLVFLLAIGLLAKYDQI